jgi:hypothetical protein
MVKKAPTGLAKHMLMQSKAAIQQSLIVSYCSQPNRCLTLMVVIIKDSALNVKPNALQFKELNHQMFSSFEPVLYSVGQSWFYSQPKSNILGRQWQTMASRSNPKTPGSRNETMGLSAHRIPLAKARVR